MTNILTEIETTIVGDFEKAETAIKIVWGVVDGAIEADAKVFVSDVGTLFSKMAAAEWVVFQGLAKQALADVLTGDWADIESDLLMKAEQAGATFVANLGSGVIQIFLQLAKTL